MPHVALSILGVYGHKVIESIMIPTAANLLLKHGPLNS